MLVSLFKIILFFFLTVHYLSIYLSIFYLSICHMNIYVSLDFRSGGRLGYRNNSSQQERDQMTS